jgi:hypothetical protein
MVEFEDSPEQSENAVSLFSIHYIVANPFPWVLEEELYLQYCSFEIKFEQKYLANPYFTISKKKPF